MRINKYLASCGLGSRRSVEKLILSGDISKNGRKIESLSEDVKTEDKIEYKGKRVKPEAFSYYLVNKPVGYVSTVSDPHAQKQIVDLVPKEPKVFPVGRLDRESEGLIILTNDGDFAQELIHPKYDHEKEYEVEAEGPKDGFNLHLDRAIRLFKCGVKIGNIKTRPAQVNVVGKVGRIVNFNIVLKEGRKRQIRITLDKAGFCVKKLKRLRIQNWVLGDLPVGKYKEFTPLEKAGGSLDG